MLEGWLSKLPFLMTCWTSIALCWGVYLDLSMYRRFGLKCLHNPFVATFVSTIAANLVLFFYLIFEPELARSAGDAILVIDVFYTCALVALTINPVVDTIS